MTAFARSTDPQTSHDAAAIAPEHLKQEVLECILRSGTTGMTLDDLEDAIPGARVVSISPNPARLAEAGLIQLAEGTRTGRSGRQQQVWVGVDGAPRPMPRRRRPHPMDATIAAALVELDSLIAATVVGSVLRARLTALAESIRGMQG